MPTSAFDFNLQQKQSAEAGRGKLRVEDAEAGGIICKKNYSEKKRLFMFFISNKKSLYSKQNSAQERYLNLMKILYLDVNTKRNIETWQSFSYIIKNLCNSLTNI